MTHKEFYIWLEGFMTNRSWVTFKENIVRLEKKLCVN
jgi:hypothetical protein